MDIPVMPVRRLQNYAYCPRLFYLQWVEGLFQENADTAEGDHVHRNIDRPENWKGELQYSEGARWQSLEIEDETLGLHGVIDLVEVGPGGLEIVDYKKGRPYRDALGAYIAKPYDAVQLAAYALLMEGQDLHVSTGRIYYAAAKQNVAVDLDRKTLEACRHLLEDARKVAASGLCPPPLESDPRCLYCSAYPICLPGESRFWSEGKLPADIEKYPPRPDGEEGEALIVQNARARVGVRGGVVVVEREGEAAVKRPIETLRGVYLYGAVQVSTQAMHSFLERNINVAYFSPAGRFIGTAHGFPATGTDARRGQYRLFEQPSIRLDLAKEIIRSKIHNQRTLLMRNGSAPDTTLAEMAGLRDATASSSDLDSLRGLEGAAAALYFSNFQTMLKEFPGVQLDWKGRNRRPPRDPVNALLSLGYSILAKEIAGMCQAVGLDPFLGFFHQPRYGRPALALDLMEEFRPLIADSVAIGLLNRKELGPDDFMHTTRGVFLKDNPRRSFWQAWSRRMDTEVTHPEFGYRMSYRRMMDVQARQLWRFCRGECSSYHGFTTR